MFDWVRHLAPGAAARRKAQAAARVRQQVQSQVERIVRPIKARYDAAMSTDDNRKHWQYADGLSANLANNPSVRYTLRNRSRYERDNNSYCKGMVNSLAYDLVGTGPRLQLMTDSEPLNKAVEREYGLWQKAINYAGKLRVMHMGDVVDGEGFLALTTNPKLGLETELDLKAFEPEQCTSFTQIVTESREIDGVRFDEFGNPETYFVLPYHPGGTVDYHYIGNPEPFPASQVIHWFKAERPGQGRGVPRLTPSLPLFAQLRRYTLAVIAAAEVAANLAAFIHTEFSPGSSLEELDSMELLEIVRGQITTLPAGWNISQLNPTQPITGYGEYVDRVLKEIARCLGMPFGIASGDSSSYNYASGRLDVQNYQRQNDVERADLDLRVNDRVFHAWLDEAVLIKGYLPTDGMPPFRQWPREWFYDPWLHVDPAKEANAAKTLLAANAMSLRRLYAEKGEDWQAAIRQIAKEHEMMKEMGLVPAQDHGGAPVPPDDGGSGADDQVPAKAA